MALPWHDPARSQSVDFRRRWEPMAVARAKSALVRRHEVDYSGGKVPEEDTALGSFSLTHWLVVLLVVLMLFGAGKLPRLMGDFAKGIRNFKTNLKDDEAAEAALAGGGKNDDRKPAESG
jgi:sec-independent protein translocase protein TatA